MTFSVLDVFFHLDNVVVKCMLADFLLFNGLCLVCIYEQISSMCFYWTILFLVVMKFVCFYMNLRVSINILLHASFVMLLLCVPTTCTHVWMIKVQKNNDSLPCRNPFKMHSVSLTLRASRILLRMLADDNPQILGPVSMRALLLSLSLDSIVLYKSFASDT